jgi:hypothetical protein
MRATVLSTGLLGLSCLGLGLGLGLGVSLFLSLSLVYFLASVLVWSCLGLGLD